ncbi:multidrug effflux MFS transporter [Phreatobacter oligotrophus]|jgi:MFS transporter, DHA1 family, multidrug resistance protein|uniref:multidrug effflux MFS transporter n=1 Tax=Phreatobacter oligotrophus TaxID=1122261 RepID=UPI0023566BA6|nr:multidrug effflux MFS transporter [Phreatobacter oligotrophus]MBX9991486.1 multidrug effflux MFS transporter [Phreatobacter oligotrophus]
MSDPRLAPRALVPLLVVLAAIGPMALNLPLPAVPGLARYFETDPGTIQLTITLYLAGMAVAQLVLGPLSDRYGRRPVILGALAVTAAMSLFAALAASAAMLILARVLQSFGASAGQVIGRAIIRDVFDKDRAASMIGWVTMAMVVAPMISPSIGGLMSETIGWRWVFAATAVIAAVTLALAAIRLPETRAVVSSPTVGQLLRDARDLVRNRMFLGYLLIGALSSVTFFSFVGGAPHATVTLMGQSSTAYGLWFMVNACGYMLGNAVCGRYAARFGSDRLIRWGSVMMLAMALVQFAIALAGWMVHPVWLFLPQAAIAFANGLQLPGAIAGAVSVRPEAAGSASGFVGFSQMGLGALAAQASGTLVGSLMSTVPMVAISVAGAVGAFLSLALIRRRDAY